MDNNMQEFLAVWNKNLLIASKAFLAAGVVVLLYYLIRLVSIRDHKAKYDFINRNEVKFLWYSILGLIISGALFANTLFAESEPIWFFVRIFITICMSIIVGVIFSNSLKFYYPFYIEKRLKKLRYTPRKSPKTGKPMKLLSEEEEDVYLDEGMQAEENVFSVDYDVWVDEETGYTQIEKYAGHLHALKCPECNYQTFKVAREEIIKSPTLSEEGELDKFYKCIYCGHKSKKTFRIAQLKETGEAEPSVATS
ncbi:hypothetical protein QQ008_09105 [Fulvivirgaceae bacterium BMA10]|uniref:Uncharacterized protein n=1 Tax=Splendidivirga corallicola TaxID=3051826 RepID=A0ABT8KMR6_9BACT|nr:hypothetical protein [Fulvivirgaceae bacterium BMA10]